MVLYPLLDMRGGASLCKPLEIPGGFGVAPVIGVSGVATTGRIWAESQKEMHEREVLENVNMRE